VELTKEVSNTRKPYFLSLLLTSSLSVVTYVMIRFVTFQYFDSFWTNWVLFGYYLYPLLSLRSWSGTE